MDETQIKVLLQEAEEHLKVMSCRSSSDAFAVRLPQRSREGWLRQNDRAAWFSCWWLSQGLCSFCCDWWADCYWGRPSCSFQLTLQELLTCVLVILVHFRSRDTEDDVVDADICMAGSCSHYARDSSSQNHYETRHHDQRDLISFVAWLEMFGQLQFSDSTIVFLDHFFIKNIMYGSFILVSASVVTLIKAVMGSLLLDAQMPWSSSITQAEIVVCSMALAKSVESVWKWCCAD